MKSLQADFFKVMKEGSSSCGAINIYFIET